MFLKFVLLGIKWTLQLAIIDNTKRQVLQLLQISTFCVKSESDFEMLKLCQRLLTFFYAIAFCVVADTVNQLRNSLCSIVHTAVHVHVVQI